MVRNLHHTIRDILELSGTLVKVTRYACETAALAVLVLRDKNDISFLLAIQHKAVTLSCDLKPLGYSKSHVGHFTATWLEDTGVEGSSCTRACSEYVHYPDCQRTIHTYQSRQHSGVF